MLCNAVQVKEDLIQRLLYFLYLAEQAYDDATEPNLKKLLSDKGGLACCSPQPAVWCCLQGHVSLAGQQGTSSHTLSCRDACQH